MRSTLDQKKTLIKSMVKNSCFLEVGGKMNFNLSFDFAFIFFLSYCEYWTKMSPYEKNVALNSPLWENCSYFVLSSLSFASNQHLGVKNKIKMKEGPKDKVSLRINLLKPIHVKKMTYQFLCSPSNCSQYQLYNWIKTNFYSYKLSWSNCWIFSPN